MVSVKSIPHAFALVLALVLPGCSQFPAMLQSEQDGYSAEGSGDTSPGVIQPGEDPGAFASPVDPDERRSNLLMTRVHLALDEGNTDAARQLLEESLEQDPDHVEALHLLAVLEVQAGELESAEAGFQVALKQDRDHPRLNGDYGYFCYLTDRWDDAERHLTRAIELDPELAEAQTNLGMLRGRQGDTAAARRHFRNAGCSEAEILNNLALVRFLEEDFESAERMYREALALDPENSSVRYGLQLASHMVEAGARETPASAASVTTSSATTTGTATVGDL